MQLLLCSIFYFLQQQESCFNPLNLKTQENQMNSTSQLISQISSTIEELWKLFHRLQSLPLKIRVLSVFDVILQQHDNHEGIARGKHQYNNVTFFYLVQTMVQAVDFVVIFRTRWIVVNQLQIVTLGVGCFLVCALLLLHKQFIDAILIFCVLQRGTQYHYCVLKAKLLLHRSDKTQFSLLDFKLNILSMYVNSSFPCKQIIFDQFLDHDNNNNNS